MNLNWGGGYTKSEVDTLLNDYIPKSGGGVISGTRLSRIDDNEELSLDGGSAFEKGATLTLASKNHPNSSLKGIFWLFANNGTNQSQLRGYPNGDLTWNNGTTTKNLAMQEDTIPRNGGSVITGYSLAKTNDTAYLEINGGTEYYHGASLVLHGKNTEIAGYEGWAILQGSTGTNSHYLAINPTTNGNIRYSGQTISRTTDAPELRIDGGSDYNHGGSISISGKERSNMTGCVELHPSLGTSGNIHTLICYPNGTLTWDGSAIQYTSDQRLKQQITEIDDKLLDAWEDVDLVQFKYNDAVDQKGDKARLHTGYVVQQIDEACQKHNIDISEYGLYCHEEYPERTEEVEIKQEDGTIKKETKILDEASEHYSLRYTETLVVECAYLRREVSKLKQQNENLEQRLKMLEQSVK